MKNNLFKKLGRNAEPDDLDGWRQWLDTHPEPNDLKGDPHHAEL